MISDTHIHSEFSSDSETPVESHIERAIELGMQYVCITDHQDYDAPLLPPLNRIYLIGDTDDTAGYLMKMREVKERYKDKITVLAGVELGLQAHLGPKLYAYVKQFHFDYVLGSSHYFNGLDGGDRRLYEGRSAQEVCRQYFIEELNNLSAFDDYDTVGHIDYVCRHAPGRLEAFHYRDYADILDEMLKLVVKNGKGLECNTCPLMDGQKMAHPHKEILARYRELGGEVIAFGSDAHTSDRVGGMFETAAEYVKEAGFKYYTVYVNREPIFIPL